MIEDQQVISQGDRLAKQAALDIAAAVGVLSLGLTEAVDLNHSIILSFIYFGLLAHHCHQIRLHEQDATHL